MDRLGRTPLHYAACDDESDGLAALIAQGFAPNAKDDNGWTSLHLAAQANPARCVAALLAAGATVSALDSNGNSPLLHAVSSSKGKEDVIHLLRDAGADPFLENAHGVSAVFLARMIANFPVAQFFPTWTANSHRCQRESALAAAGADNIFSIDEGYS